MPDTILAALDSIEADAREAKQETDGPSGWFTGAYIDITKFTDPASMQHIANASPDVVIALVQVARLMAQREADSVNSQYMSQDEESALAALRETLGAGG